MKSGIHERVCVGDQIFTFTLCRKAVQLGNVEIDHWWMQTTELYRQQTVRRCKGGNYEAVTEAFWALCCREGSQAERDVQESYLLARLLPFARSHGSRRIVADAFMALWTVAAQAKREAVQDLDLGLRSSCTETLTPRRFSRRTADVIGPPVLSKDVKQTYLNYCTELFDPAVALLGDDKEAAVAQLQSGWQRLMQAMGRRRGRLVEKHVLDILSYEARAALHRCYSAAWHMLLLPHLAQEYQFSVETVKFLRLWHLDQVSESSADAYFHLFHGHIFALHPATALFLSTSMGRELVGSWLKRDSKRTFGRLLHGIFVAVHLYAGLREAVAQRRRKQPKTFGGRELISLEIQRATRRRRRSPNR